MQRLNAFSEIVGLSVVKNEVAQTSESGGDESNAQAFFERTVVAAIRFCGQSIYMFRFPFAPPSLLPTMAAAQDSRLAPPLTFLTVGVLVAGFVQRLAYAIDPGMSYTADAFTAEFHESYRQISLWDVSLRTFPGVVLVVLIGALVAKLAQADRRFDRNPIVATACYAVGLHALAVGLVYFLIMWINAYHSDEFGLVIGRSMMENLIIGIVGLTGLYGAAAIASSIRIAGQRRWVTGLVARLSIGTAATILLVAVTYITVEVSFETASAESRRDTRWQQEMDYGFRVSLVDSVSLPDERGQRTRLHATLALTNVSEDKMLIPRHRELITSDDQLNLPVLSNSVDLSEDRALIIQPNQTRVVQLQIDMTKVRMKLLRGDLTQRVVFPFHKATNGYAYQRREHYLSLPLPELGVIGRGINPPSGAQIGRQPGYLSR